MPLNRLTIHRWCSRAKFADALHCSLRRYAGDAEGKGGIYNFVTKRGLCHGAKSKISWTQVRIKQSRLQCFAACRIAGPGM
jgi:Fe-S cluster assembly scaffold protein SufB